jgi:hypothetical protein
MISNLDIGPLQSGSGLDIGVLQSSASMPRTISPAAPIPTGELWGSPDVAGPIKLGAAIPTGEHWGTPALQLGNQTLTFPAHPTIPSGERWGSPDIAGPIKLGAAIPTGEHWLSPTVKVSQTITLASAIPSGETWYTPFVSTLAIAPPKPAIPSGETWFAPTVGADQFINVSGRPAIPTGESWPIPVIQGGDGGLRVFLGGVDLTSLAVTSAFSPQGAGTNALASTIVSQAIGRATLTIDYVDIGGLLVPGEFPNAQELCGVTIKVVEAGLTLFAGCIDTVGVDREMPFSTPACITYHITALDKTSICDHRVVTGYVFPAGSDIAQDVLYVVANFLNGEGITTQGVPTDGSLGDLDSATSGQYETVRQMFDELATDAGCVWWIDQYGVLYFQPVTSLPVAPWGLDETQPDAPFRNSLGTPMVQNSVSGGSQTSGFRNKEYVVSNLNTVPGSNPAGGGGTTPTGTVETITFTEGEPGVWDDPPGTPYGILSSLPIGNIQSLTVNGVTQTVYELSSYAGQTSSGAGDFLWAYLAGGTQVGPTFGPIPSGAAIVITYTPGNGSNPASVVVGSASNPLTPTGPTFGHCGSGVFEVIDQVKNVSSIADLNALAQSFLNRSGAIPQILTFETDKPGLFVGQGLSVYLPSLGIPGTGSTPVTFVISQISGTAQDWYLAYGSFYRWTVTAINNYDPANWITYYSRMIAQSENALPVLQAKSYSWALGNGSNVAAGTGLTNPLQVQSTGLLVTVAIAAQVPPVNQNLQVQLFADGLLFATIILGAGATPNVFVTQTIPAASGIYLYTGQVLTISATYLPTGGTPAKAQGVTVVATITM